MYQPKPRQPQHNLNQLAVELCRIGHYTDLSQRKRIHQTHDDGMPVPPHRLRHEESCISQSAEESPLLPGCQSGHVHPTPPGPLPKVVPILLNRPEAGPSQPMNLKHQPPPRRRGNNENIRLLAHAYLISDAVDGAGF